MENICCIIDFEGFLVPTMSSRGEYKDYRFMLKECAYIRIDPQTWYVANSRFFDLRKFEWPLLDPVSRRAIQTQERDFHGLSFWPTPEEEKVQDLINYNDRIEYLQVLQNKCCRSPKKETIAFYQGRHEKNFLAVAQVPSLALKAHNCPDYDSLLSGNPSYGEITCGFHKHGTRDTCPKAKVTAFRDWWMQRYSRC